MAEYKVVEIFESINGEGTRAGQLAVFVRFQGCNLSCSYCDTAWANEENASYIWMTQQEIMDKIKATNIKKCNTNRWRATFAEGHLYVARSTF